MDSWQARELIKVRRAVLLDRAGEMRLGIKEKLEQVMKETKTLITCVGRNDELTRSDASLQLLGTGLEIEGPEASVRDAKVRSLVMLDMTVRSHHVPRFFMLIPNITTGWSALCDSPSRCQHFASHPGHSAKIPTKLGSDLWHQYLHFERQKETAK